MKTTTGKGGFAVGSVVMLTDEYLNLFETETLRNVICEVVDVRLAGGRTYAYRVSPVGDRTRAVEAYAHDLRAVRS